MSKYIYEITPYYQTNSNCSYCKAIDKFFEKIKNYSLEDKQREIPNIEKLLVNGYNVLDVLIAENKQIPNFANYSLYQEDLLKAIKNIYTKTDFNSYNSKRPSTLFCRYCKKCGARKHNIFDSHLLFNDIYDFTLQYENNQITLNLPEVDYLLTYTYKIFKKPYNEQDYKLLLETTDTQVIDTEIADNMAYVYKLQIVDELNCILHESKKDILIPIKHPHIPNKIEYVFKKHHYLDENLNQKYYVYADYKESFDLQDVVFKLNQYHAPAHDKWFEDIEIHNKEHFVFPNKDTTYFMKPFLMSREFLQDSQEAHKYTPLYFWNYNQNVVEFKYSDFPEDLYNLTFEDEKRTMKINYSLSHNHQAKVVRIVFKQDDKYILDNDFTGYKVVDIPISKATYDYEVIINNLASNTKWVFGVFPIYKNTDEDIRLKFQTIVKIKPHWEEYITKFYDIGKWHKDKDFYNYKYETYIHEEVNDTDVMLCEQLNKKECSPILIHLEDCSEKVILTYDFKFLSKAEVDRLHHHVNDELKILVSNTYKKWLSAEETFFNKEWYIFRWELMKMSDMPSTGAFLKNVLVHNIKTIDELEDNYTVNMEVKFKNVYKYNRTIKHNNVHLHVADRYLSVTVDINKYYDNEDIVEVKKYDINKPIIIGNPSYKIDWLP